MYYAPCSNPEPVHSEAVCVIKEAVDLLISNEVLHHDIERRLGLVSLYIDTNMNLINGVLSYSSSEAPMTMFLSPIIIEQLMWLKHNENAVSVVVHELTHLAQMARYSSLLWGIASLPVISGYTVEKWAIENEEVARNYLMWHYRTSQ